MVADTNRPQDTPEPREPQPGQAGRRAEGVGPLPVHGSAAAPSVPNLAAAQIPGPGTVHIIAGETAVVPDDGADPFEKQGHEHAHHESGRRRRRWPWRLFGRH
jgi:hypothetical protein